MVAMSNTLPLPLSAKHLADLKASGLTEEQIRRVGYRSVDKAKAQQVMGYNLPGLLIPYRDPFSQPFLTSDKRPFYRIKPDYEGEHDPDSPKYLSPKGKGSLPFFSPLYPDSAKALKSTKHKLWEVEGEKKADKACAEGFLAIGLAGVTAWQDKSTRSDEVEQAPAQLMEDPLDLEAAEAAFKLEESRQLPELLEHVTYKYRDVYQCYDSDIVSKRPVRAALVNRARHLQANEGAYPYAIILPNELDGSKNGIDDFLVRHGREALQLLSEFPIPTLVKNRKNQWVANPQLTEPKPHYKTVLAWSVFKEAWAYRPGIGWYEWAGNHWTLHTEDEFEAVLTQFMDRQLWEERGTGTWNSIMKGLKTRLLRREHEWNRADRLVFKNGTLKLATNVFEGRHERFDYMTSCLPFDYNLIAACPTWHNFLHEATGGNQQLIDLLQAWTKYLVMPKDRTCKAEIEKALVLIGRKGTGKGTFLDVLVNLIGEENIGSASPDTFKDDKSLAQLLDKTVAMEQDASGFLGGVGNFNKVVSNELVPVKKLYKDSTTTRLGCSVVLAMNKYPDVPAGSEGLDRRLCVIPFDHPPAVTDTQLSQKLGTELSGIFAWAWSLSAVEMKRRILWSGAIEAVQEASIDRFEENNPEFRFLRDTYPAGMTIQAKLIYEDYQKWCEANGIKPKSQHKLGPILESLGCKKSRTSSNCQQYQVPKMREFDVAVHLGIVRPVEVDGQTQAAATFGASPELRPELSTDCPDSVPELSELSDQNSSKLKEKIETSRAACHPLEKVGYPNVRNVRDAHAVRVANSRHEPPAMSASAVSALIPQLSAQPKGIGSQPTLTVKAAPAPRPKDEICLGMRVNKRYKTGWAGEVVEIVNDESVEVLWSGESTSNRVKKSELKEDVRYRNP